MSQGRLPSREDAFARAEELEALRARLHEAEDTLRAIQQGEADAVVVHSPSGARVYTLTTADESYRTLVEQMRDAALILSDEGTILYCNARLGKLIGDDASTGRPVATLAVEEDRAAILDLLEHGRSGGAAGEFRFARAGGGPVPVHLSLGVLHTGGFTGLVGIATDLTEQKRREEEAERERLTSAVLEFAGTPILVCDRAGNVLRANREALALCGASCVGRAFEEVLPLGIGFAELCEMGVEEPRDVARFSQTGEERFLQVRARRIGGGPPEADRWVVTLTDLTQRKRAEDALRLAKEAAEAANRSKGDFLRIMSHELRTPLNSVLGYADLLLSEIAGPLEGEQRTQVERIQVSARHQVSLIEEILTYARVEAGQERLQLARADVCRIVREVAESLRPEADRKGLGLTVRCSAEEGLQVITDEAKLRRILINLVGNATKFTRRGSVEVAVGSEDDQHLVVHVRDTGPGIPHDHLETIWDPFTQVDPSPARESGGTGLGLAIVRQLTEFLGGEVTVASELGRGTTFSVRLPTPPEVRGPRSAYSPSWARSERQNPGAMR